MTEEGYLQIKIRELDEQLKEKELKIKELDITLKRLQQTTTDIKIIEKELKQFNENKETILNKLSEDFKNYLSECVIPDLKALIATEVDARAYPKQTLEEIIKQTNKHTELVDEHMEHINILGATVSAIMSLLIEKNVLKKKEIERKRHDVVTYFEK